MKILSKSEIIQRFSIGKDVYINSKLDGTGFSVNGDAYNTNGVIFTGHWAYYTNNHFILRCPAHDRPYYDANLEYEYNNDEDPIKQLDSMELEAKKQGRGQTLLFYNYENDKAEDKGTCNELTEYWIKSFEQCFMNFRANKVIFKKNDLLARLDDIFGKKVNDRAMSAVVMVPDFEAEVLRCKVIRIKKKDPSKEVEFVIPIYVDPFMNWHTEPTYQPMMAISALYVNLLQAFQENDFIKMEFNYLPANPKERNKYISEYGSRSIHRVSFAGMQSDTEEHPEIMLGLPQITPNYNPFE